MDTFIYFAYGSNMLTERLRERCPSAEPIGIAMVNGYEVCFQKESKKDGSGKATLVRSSSPLNKSRGVLFQINKSELGRLDRAEGAEGKNRGYYRDNWFPVASIEGGNILTVTYIAIAEKLKEGLTPYDWYLALVVAGIKQHHLPKEYSECLQRINVTQDINLDRKERKDALKVLEQAGYKNVYTEISTRLQ